MAGSVGSAERDPVNPSMSRRHRCTKHSPQPGIVTTFESVGGVFVFKQPPSRHAGELPSSEAIGLAVGRDGRQQVEEVEYDARTSSVFDAEGNEGLERVASVV